MYILIKNRMKDYQFKNDLKKRLRKLLYKKHSTFDITLQIKWLIPKAFLDIKLQFSRNNLASRYVGA